MTRTHYQTESDGPLAATVCGWLNGDMTRLTRDPLRVDCELCKRQLAKAAESGKLEMPDAAELYAERVFTPGPATEYNGDWAASLAARLIAKRRPPLILATNGSPPDPSMDPHERDVVIAEKRAANERWQAMRNGCECGTCEVCVHRIHAAQDMARDPWRRKHAIHTEDRPRWSSVAQALEAYVGYRLDGYPAKAWGGTYETIRTLGSFVQCEGGERSFTAAQRAAHDVAAVDAALAGAFDDDYQDQGLTNATCLGVVLARVVGNLERASDAGRIVQRYVPVHAAEVAAALGITQDLVREITREGVTAIHGALELRGMVPARRRTA